MKKYRPTPMQEAMLFETQNAPGRYITRLCYTLKTPKDSDSLTQRLRLLVRRHEILRTRFVRGDDGILWLETGEDNAGHFHVSLTGSDELSVEFNHIMLDGWSVSNLMREFMADDEPDSEASPFRYYAKWLKQRASQSDLGWWKNYLDGIDISELPNKSNTSDYERRELRFTINDSKLLRKTARDLRVTAGRLIQAVWCMLLARYNGGSSLVCVVNSGRSAPVPGITGMTGMLVNTLPVGTRLPSPPESVSFADWVYSWSRETTEAEKHGFYAPSDLVNGAIPHILSIDPPFDGDGYRLISSNAELVTDFDVAFTLNDTITAEFAYNTRAYSDEAATAIMGHFQTAIKAVLDNPGIPLEEIPILTEAEIAEQTKPNVNKDILEIINHRTVVHFLRECARKYSYRTAIVCGDVRLTYAELESSVNKLTSALRENGVTTEIPVAVLLPRSEKYVIAELAIMNAGGFFLPLDTDWPEHRIKSILTEVNPRLVIDENTYNGLLTLESGYTFISRSLPSHAAYMIMTSGTTGTPKGIVIEHRSLSNFCFWAKQRYDWQPGCSCALELGFAFDGSIWSIYPPLISGGTLHIVPYSIRFDLAALGGYCRTERITHIDLPVTMAEAFREIYRDDNALPHLRVMVTGGEEVRRILPAPYPLSNEYGPTECTVCCSASWLDGNIPITIGSPIPNMNAYILDEWKRLCPDGVTGEAYFSGVQVARGYYNAPELTAARFHLSQFASGDPNHRVLYQTGDLMYRNNHRELVFKGRTDNQVKLNGFRVELEEIENVLRSHNDVRSVSVVIKDKQLCAFVAVSESLDKSELYELISSKLPAFMRPVITLVSSIPLTSSGKVDYEKLQSLNDNDTTGFIAPFTEKERIITSVISRLLGVSSIGTNYNYLELGGNSINAMRISFCLDKEGYMLSAKDLITSLTIGSAAAKMIPTAVNNQVGEVNQTTFTPLSAQQAMVFLAKVNSSTMYTVTAIIDAPGLDIETLEKRIERAAGLHDILRTEFYEDNNGKITGRINDTHKIRLKSNNFNDKNSIDPLRDPLLTLNLNGEKLTIYYHHIALDGYSINLLVQELIYGIFLESAPSFADFANRLSGQAERQSRDRQWWNDCCRDVKTIPILPMKTDKPPKYKRIPFCTPELHEKCTEAAKTVRVTPAAFMLTAWSVVVEAVGAEDTGILIPFTASCRGDDNLMGMCAGTIPLIFEFTDNSFGELARNVQNAMLESVSHWFVPQEIIRELPGYLFVFEEGNADFTAGGEQNYDLVIKFSGKGELIYNSIRLPEENAKRIAKYLDSSLNAAISDRVSIMDDNEYELVTGSFAQGRSIDINVQTAAQAFASAAGLYAERTALETDSETLTYAELHERVIKLSKALSNCGFGAGDIVAFCLPRNSEGIIAQLGIALSGAAFLPIDPAWPDGRSVDILNDSGAVAVIRDGLSIELTDAHGKVQSDTSYVIYTSGTTGKPKGVVVPKAALANQIAWAIDEFNLSYSDKMLHYIAFTFDPSVWVLFTALSAGATLSLLPEETRLDPCAVASYILKRGITRCTLPAAVAPDVLRHVESSHLRTVFLGGEAVKNLPPCDFEVVNCYGPTETCINAAFYRLKPGETETRIIGRPVANTSCYVLNARGAPCPVGIQGELHIGGVQLASGYLGFANSDAFTVHPDFGRLYKTGDRAAWNADGTLTFLGRRDSQVKIRGNRVELSEIECVLRDLSGVSDAKVIYKDGALDAYITASGNTDISALKKRLPSYMLPRSVTVLESFPLTENGKLDINALPSPSMTTAESYEPLAELEAAIASAWKTALGLAQDFIIRRGDSFFELGGHSLLLFHVVGLLAANGVTADIKTLIEYPVLADVAEAIKQREAKSAPKPKDSSEKSMYDYYSFIKSLKSISLSEKRDFHNVLITGGTGFLGSHLVREIYEETGAVIHLPIRGETARLQGVLGYYFGALGAEMIASGRLRAFRSDICEKPPDIDVPLDVIFHTAADIRHYAPEHEMIEANVTATEHMLALAEKNPDALFAHISTTSAVNAPVIYETDIDLGPEFENIYQRTKQLAEQRVLEAGRRGLKFAVFRVGHVSPGFENGSVARNWEINAMLRLTGAMLLTELLPEQDYQIGYGYVDKTARALRLLSTPTSLTGHVFHIDNPKTLRLSEIFALAGLRGSVIPKTELSERLKMLSDSQDMAIRQAASEYLGRLSQGSLEKDSADIVAGKIHMDATLFLLKRLGFEWPYVTAEYVKGIIENLKSKSGGI